MRFLTSFIATHACISSCRTSTAPFGTASQATTMLPYRSGHRKMSTEPAASVPCLSPVTFSARIHLTSELLRFPYRMAASKPTSWLSLRFHILFHLATDLGTLAGGLGSFPLDHGT